MNEVKTINRRTFKEIKTELLAQIVQTLDEKINARLRIADYYKKHGFPAQGAVNEAAANALIEVRHEIALAGLEIVHGGGQ